MGLRGWLGSLMGDEVLGFGRMREFRVEKTYRGLDMYLSSSPRKRKAAFTGQSLSSLATA